MRAWLWQTLVRTRDTSSRSGRGLPSCLTLVGSELVGVDMWRRAFVVPNLAVGGSTNGPHLICCVQAERTNTAFQCLCSLHCSVRDSTAQAILSSAGRRRRNERRPAVVPYAVGQPDMGLTHDDSSSFPLTTEKRAQTGVGLHISARSSSQGKETERERRGNTWWTVDRRYTDQTRISCRYCSSVAHRDCRQNSL
ncbi:hypothetical protein VTK73DRAFT_1072 [Phialemonium thermophilum]|uniref:Uncharacterized protein n=1 Tax=Phialemonium thermophilum TaxID=223376 RepID=A0ABR3VTW7_9PEZI